MRQCLPDRGIKNH
ncbi:hypothetical protein MYG02_12070 [Citrobacter sedlakii]|nr:hypothetical protein [Citrobacter sedlakii]